MKPAALLLALPMWLLAPQSDDTTPLAPSLGQGEYEVTVEIVDEVPRCSIRAQDAPVHRVVQALANEIGAQVEGFEPGSRAALVTVELRGREVRLALEYVLGSVGLRADQRPGVISVFADALPTDESAVLLDRAMVAYLEATRRFPYHALGAKALLAQGEIEERRNRPSAALNRYETLLETFQTNTLVPLAMLRTGLLLEQLGQFSEAKSWYGDLAGLESNHGYEEPAWIGMARVSNAMREFGDALNIVQAMEADIPLTTAADERARMIEKTRALNGLGQHHDALRVLDQLDRLGMPDADRVTSFALRGAAFEGLELYGEAGRSWLLHSHGVAGDARQAALENAARLALLDGDELGVLLIVDQAKALGQEAGLEPFELEVRRRLGMTFVVEEGSGSPLQRLELAEELAEAGDLAEAEVVVEGLFDARDSLAPRDLARVYRLRALAVEGRAGLEEAIDLLRRQRSTLQDPAARAVLDVVAGELYERHGLYAEAADAYGGRL